MGRLVWTALALSIVGGSGIAATLWALWRGSKAQGDAKALREKLARYEYAALKVDEAFTNQAKELELTRTEMAEQIARRERVIISLRERIQRAEDDLAKSATPGTVRSQLRDIFSGDES